MSEVSYLQIPSESAKSSSYFNLSAQVIGDITEQSYIYSMYKIETIETSDRLTWRDSFPGKFRPWVPFEVSRDRLSHVQRGQHPSEDRVFQIGSPQISLVEITSG